MTAIRVDGLRKSYGDFAAVQGHLLRGGRRVRSSPSSGATAPGKTTTMELLAGFQAPDGGTVRVLGLDPATGSGSVRAGAPASCSRRPGFFPDLTVAQTVDTWRDFTAAPRPARRGAGNGRAGRRRRARRCASSPAGRSAASIWRWPCWAAPTCCSSTSRPPGWTPRRAANTWEVIRDLAGQGTTILLTTHYLEEAQRLAASMAIMDGGEIVAGRRDGGDARRRSRRVAFRLPARRPHRTDLPRARHPWRAEIAVCRGRPTPTWPRRRC